MIGPTGAMPATALRVLPAFALALLIACSAPLAGDAPADGPISSAGESLYFGFGDADVARAVAAIQNTLEHRASGETGRWRNDGAGTSGEITPLRTFKTTQGFFCRTFNETVRSAQGERTTERLSCRDKNGLWRPATARETPAT